jgi:alkylglycerol monooxygenase
MINTIALLIPLFLIVVSIEGYVSHKSKNNRYKSSNTTINLTIGAIDQISSLFYFVLLYFVMDYAYVHFRMISIDSFWYQWVFGYITIDFLSYWFHRWSHKVNILWAGHITHHSSDLFNLSNGFRTSFFQALNRILFWSILPIFGFSPVILIILLKVSGIFDFIQHTQYIPRLGFLEKILVTPSLHRVHHGKNDIYIDKNYGSTFIIWDKLFGTYQAETEKVVFGIKGNYVDKNPLSAIGHYSIFICGMKSIQRLCGGIKLEFYLWLPPIIKFKTMIL